MKMMVMTDSHESLNEMDSLEIQATSHAIFLIWADDDAVRDKNHAIGPVQPVAVLLSSITAYSVLQSR